MHKTVFLAAFAVLTPIMPALAAQAPAQAVTISVPHGDLDLAKPADVTILKRRIAKAVGRACRSPSSYSGSLVVTDQKCRADALEAALAVMERRRAVQVAAAD